MNNNVDINNKLVGSKILKTFWAASWSASHRGTIFDKVTSVLSQPFSYIACLQRSADGHVWADSRTGWTITTLHWDLRLFALSFIYFYCFFTHSFLLSDSLVGSIVLESISSSIFAVFIVL